MQVFSGWYFVVGNVHFHKLLILKMIEELCATIVITYKITEY
jgi:hypothetical protein